jgi:hypothetical protein
MWVLLAMVILAKKPAPTNVFYVVKSNELGKTGYITTLPFTQTGSQQFKDDQEVLSSITTANSIDLLCSLEMTSLALNE